MRITVEQIKNRIRDLFAGKLPYRVQLLMAYVVVCVLAIIIVTAETVQALPEPTAETSAAPTQVTLPPNPYGAEDFAYDENGYLTCTAGESRLGIDVSSHQKDIDWQQVAQSGVEFAFVRIGYRGFTEGGLFPDEYAEYNLREAKAAGLEVGAYFYSQALNEAEAREEAEYCLEFLKDCELDLPLVYDWEYVSGSARTADMDSETLTACAKTFCETVEEAGYEPMVYFNRELDRTLYDLRALQAYPFWFALYSESMDYPYAFDIWQYTNTGTVPGIEGDVDLNLWLG